MPLFEYICKDCSEISEQLATGSRQPVCPNCGSKKLEKPLSRFSAQVSSTTYSTPPCGTASCPTRGGGGSGGGCPHSH